MFKYYHFYFLISALFIISCSSQEVVGLKDKPLNYDDSLKAKDECTSHFIDGNIYEVKGDYESALKEYNEALNLMPSAGIYYSIAKINWYLDKDRQALENILKAVEIEPKNIPFNDLLAEVYTALGLRDSASSVLNKIISIDSSQINTLYKLANIYEKDKPLSAVKIYNHIIEQEGPIWEVYARLAELNEKLNNFQDALKNVEDLLLIDPSNLELQNLAASYCVKLNNYDKAINILDNILESHPNETEAREQKAQIYINQKNYKAALKEFDYFLFQDYVSFTKKLDIGLFYFRESLSDTTLRPIAKEYFEKLDKDTSAWEVKLYLGAIALNEKNEEAALSYFKYITENAEWQIEGWQNLANIYYDKGKYEDAIKIAEKGIEHFPDNYGLHFLCAISYSMIKKDIESEKHILNCLKTNPRDPAALSIYSYTLIQLKKNEDAYIYIKKALSYTPEDVNLLGSLGMVCDALEKWDECDSAYSEALIIDSLNSLINNNYAYSLSERGIDLDNALRMIKISVAADSLNSSYLDTMGWIYFKLNKYSEAMNYIEKAIEVNGGSPVLFEHLGDVYFKQGQKEKAKSMWEKSYSLDSKPYLKLKIEKGEI
ncbi:MAG TPA: tetratricopeptide repeat protein [Ignavibacteriaceae bacterium]|nr:tetratricopeptide repeat protein [Ignavibacteriaceae bacterium]